MHPELEFFLENAFGRVQPTSGDIGRVVVEPDYEIAPETEEAAPLASELVQCLREARVDEQRLAGPQGCEVEIAGTYHLLRKYVRRITLHADSIEGDWVEVAPPGSWI